MLMKRFKSAILFSIFFILGIRSANAQIVNQLIPDGKYYIVRHAEKDTGKNPSLTVAGYLRSGDLYRALKNKRIHKIYVSQFRRTHLTADSLRIYQKIDTVHYLADTSAIDLINKITSQNHQPENVLIIGHSNTVPVIIKKLGIPDFLPNELPDHEHDNLYVITKKKNKAFLRKLKYGNESKATGMPSKMKPLQ